MKISLMMLLSIKRIPKQLHKLSEKIQYIVNTIKFDTFDAAFQQANTNLTLYFAYRKIKSANLTRMAEMGSGSRQQTRR